MVAFKRIRISVHPLKQMVLCVLIAESINTINEGAMPVLQPHWCTFKSVYIRRLVETTGTNGFPGG